LKRVSITISTDYQEKKTLLINISAMIPRRMNISADRVRQILVEIKRVNWEGKTRATGTVKYDFFTLFIIFDDGKKFKLFSMNHRSYEGIMTRPQVVEEVVDFLEKFGKFDITSQKDFY
jgi:hypothetical protein